MIFSVFRRSTATFSVFAAIAATVCSCNFYSSDEETVEETAEEFGNHLFNYELNEAAMMTTSESRKWVELMASNADTATVAMIRSQDEAATVSVDNLSLLSDSTAAVELIANNFVWAKDIDGTPEVVDEMRFSFTMVKRGNKWFVRMDNLLQSGK